jgi:hypothetical protein
MTDEVARRLKWEIDAGRVWVTAYSNDFPCYIASKRVLDEGGYEADQSMVFYGRPARLAPEAEDLIIRTVHHLLPPGFDGPRRPWGGSGYNIESSPRPGSEAEILSPVEVLRGPLE